MHILAYKLHVHSFISTNEYNINVFVNEISISMKYLCFNNIFFLMNVFIALRGTHFYFYLSGNQNVISVLKHQA